MMFKKTFFLVILILVCTAFSIPEKVEKKANKVISKFYETSDFYKEHINVSEEIDKITPSIFGNENFFKIVSKETFLGYGYIGNATSKTATFDYLVLFDKDFIITKIKVLIYREEYGGEISSKRWLKQFIGKTSASEVIYNENIIPISGATISVKSMTIAINDLLKSINKLNKLNLLPK